MRTESWRLAAEINAMYFAPESGERLFADGGGEGLVSAAPAADVDAQALDFLIERGERDHEALGGFGLVPGSAFEHVNDDAALDFIHDLKQGRLRIIRGRTRAGLARRRRKKL